MLRPIFTAAAIFFIFLFFLFHPVGFGVIMLVGLVFVILAVIHERRKKQEMEEDEMIREAMTGKQESSIKKETARGKEARLKQRIEELLQQSEELRKSHGMRNAATLAAAAAMYHQIIREQKDIENDKDFDSYDDDDDDDLSDLWEDDLEDAMDEIIEYEDELADQSQDDTYYNDDYNDWYERTIIDERYT